MYNQTHTPEVYWSTLVRQDTYLKSEIKLISLLASSQRHFSLRAFIIDLWVGLFKLPFKPCYPACVSHCAVIDSFWRQYSGFQWCCSPSTIYSQYCFDIYKKKLQYNSRDTLNYYHLHFIIPQLSTIAIPSPLIIILRIFPCCHGKPVEKRKEILAVVLDTSTFPLWSNERRSRTCGSAGRVIFRRDASHAWIRIWLWCMCVRVCVCLFLSEYVCVKESVSVSNSVCGWEKVFLCACVGITALRWNLPVGGRYNTCVPGPHIKKVGAGSWPRCGSKTPSLCNNKPFKNIYQRPVNDRIEIEMLPSVFLTPLSEIVLANPVVVHPSVCVALAQC